jgi:hypothetical protein
MCIMHFCFFSDGTIPIGCYNAPGSFHDSRAAELGLVYHELDRVYQATGGKCTADAGFPK